MTGQDHTAIRTERRQLRASALMLLCALAQSLDPLAAAAVNAPQAPFHFSALVQAGQGAAYAALAATICPGLLRNREVRAAILCWTLNWRRGGPLLLMGVLSGMDYVFYLHSARYLDISAAAVLAEFWSLFAVPLTWLLARNSTRYRRPGAVTMTCLGLTCGGAALTVAGQTAALHPALAVPVRNLALGAAFGIFSALSVALAVCLFRWSEELTAMLPPEAARRHSHLRLELFGVAVAILLTSAVSMTVNATLGAATGESLAPLQAAAALTLGTVVYFAASALWRAANIIALDLSVNALGSFTPLLALGWLWCWQLAGGPAAGQLLTLPRPHLVAAGAAMVAAANLTLHRSAAQPAEQTQRPHGRRPPRTRGPR